MIAIRFEINETLTAGFGTRHANRATKAGWEAAGKQHHAQHIPKHFSYQARGLYGYGPRKGEPGNLGSWGRFKGSYTHKKLRLYGHTRPLEFSGQTRLLARRENVAATSKGARVKLPRGLSRKHPDSRINMRAEATAITATERAKLVQTFEGRLIKGLQEPAPARRVRIRN